MKSFSEPWVAVRVYLLGDSSDSSAVVREVIFSYTLGLSHTIFFSLSATACCGLKEESSLLSTL